MDSVVQTDWLETNSQLLWDTGRQRSDTALPSPVCVEIISPINGEGPLVSNGWWWLCWGGLCPDSQPLSVAQG